MATNIQDVKSLSDLISRCSEYNSEVDPWIESYVFLEGSCWEYGLDKFKKYFLEKQ